MRHSPASEALAPGALFPRSSGRCSWWACTFFFEPGALNAKIPEICTIIPVPMPFPVRKEFPMNMRSRNAVLLPVAAIVGVIAAAATGAVWLDRRERRASPIRFP